MPLSIISIAQWFIYISILYVYIYVNTKCVCRSVCTMYIELELLLFAIVLKHYVLTTGIEDCCGRQLLIKNGVD